MVFYFFIDGIGYGEKNPDTNPFTRYSESIFFPLGGNPPQANGILYLETDAKMGVPGIPQSATGQTALWTGINAPQILGRHITGFPTFTLKKIIAKHSILKVLKDNQLKVDLLNCYSPYYIHKVGKDPRFQSASTLVQMASGNPLKNLDDLREYKGLYMDITHRLLKQFAGEWIEDGDPILEFRDPYEVGKMVPIWFQDYDLTIFEYFITDKAGHDQNWEVAKMAIHDLERFLEGILETMDPSRDSLVVTSDHGNMEDLSTERHTENPVPTLLYGKITREDPSLIQSLKDIPLFLYRHLGLEKAIEDLERSSKELQKNKDTTQHTLG